MPVLTRFKLDGGTNQAAARKLLPPEGLLRRVVNLELRRDSELGVRPGFSSLGNSQYGSVSTVVLHDVVPYDGRLFAFGKPSSLSTVNTLLEYVDAVKAWRVIQSSFPDSTAVREIGSPAEQEGGIRYASCAAYDGVVVFAWQPADSDDSFTHVFRARDGASLIHQELGAGDMQRPVCLTTAGPRMHIVGVDDTPTTLNVLTYTPGSTESFGARTALQSVDDKLFAACAVQGSPGGYVTVGVLAGDLVVRHYSDGHVQQMTRTITGLGTILQLAVSANGAADTILIGTVDNTGGGGFKGKYRTILLSAGTDVAGPTEISATTTSGQVTVHQSASSSYAAVNISGATLGTVIFGAALNFEWEDAKLTTHFLPYDNGIGLVGVIQGSTGLKVSAMMTVGDPGTPLWFKDFGTALVTDDQQLGALVRDSVTGLYYAVSFRQNNDLEVGAHVVEFALDTLARRQTAIAGGLLHIAGALPLVFDGLQAYEMSWGQAPRFRTIASSNSTGSITSEADYFLQAHAEMVDSRGNVHRGPPSVVEDHTTAAGDDTITGFVSSLHSLRNNVPGVAGLTYRIRIFRTAALADGTAGENLYSETSVTVRDPTDWGEALAFTLEASDATLRVNGATRGTIYTQGQTPIPHQAPPPFQFCWPTNERLAVAGLPRSDQWLQSKLRVPGEALHFSDQDLIQYAGSCDEAIRAVASIGGQLVVFTRRTISLWTGDGPDHSGQGEFTFSGFLSREGGIVDWRSLVEADEMLFFQRESDQLCILSKSGDVGWTVTEGQAVRDELAAYPVVVAACHLRRQHAVVFAVESTAGDAGELLVYDTRRKTWSIWDIHAQAVCEYQGRLVYVSQAGLALMQHENPGSGAMPTQVFETFDFDFGTGLSWGEAISFGAIGTKKGDASAALAITYDSGDSWSTIETFTVTTAGGYVTNKPFELKKAIPVRDCSRFAIRLTISGGSDTEGLRINEVVLETETAPGMARLPARDTK